jgi:hypothetical protein
VSRFTIRGLTNYRGDDKARSLEALNNNELREVINHSEALLKKRDEERKAKAIADVRALRVKAENDARTLLDRWA